MGQAGANQPPEEGDEIEITDEMLDAGVGVFWDYCEDKFAITYDARPFVRTVFEQMALLQVRRKGSPDGQSTN